MDDPRIWTERAVALGEQSVRRGDLPFGAVLVTRDGATVEATNTTLSDGDPVAHAEVQAVRAAIRRHGAAGVIGATIASSCEPCPMCQAVSLLYQAARIFYAVPAADAARHGFPMPQGLAAAHRALDGALLGFIAHVDVPDAARPMRQWAARQAR